MAARQETNANCRQIKTGISTCVTLVVTLNTFSRFGSFRPFERRIQPLNKQAGLPPVHIG
jgi:hypothetical protein